MTLNESSLTTNHALHLGRTRKARLKSISSAYQFFRKNAGGIVGKNALYALRLAKAESFATDAGWNCIWENDECIGCDCGNESCPCSSGKPHSSLACILYDANDVVHGSLGSICEPTYTYRRVVEAELALEAQGTPASPTEIGGKSDPQGFHEYSCGCKVATAEKPRYYDHACASCYRAAWGH